MRKEQLGIVPKIIPIIHDGALDLEAYKKYFRCEFKLVTVTHVSNTFGTINPVKEITALAHAEMCPFYGRRSSDTACTY